MNSNATARHDPRFGSRPWSKIERYMERARDLRSKVCGAALSRAFGTLRNALAHCKAKSAELGKGAATIVVTASAMAIAFPPAFAQEMRMSTMSQSVEGDAAALAALGIDAGSIEQCNDLERLWAAVRELVLPGRISEATQHRILRRVWILDPDTRHGSVVDSQNH